MHIFDDLCVSLINETLETRLGPGPCQVGLRALPLATGNFIPLLATFMLSSGLILASCSNLIPCSCHDLFADVTPPQTAGYIEITDLQSKKLRYIPIPR